MKRHPQYLEAMIYWYKIMTCLLLFVMFSFSAEGQITANFFDINPNNSTLDATNPNGASGGRVNGLGVASDASAYYAASEWGGIYRSNDGGQNWFRLNAHLPSATWDVEVDPSNNNRLYATSFYDGRVNSLAGINVSTDGGVTWNRPATTIPPSGLSSAIRRQEPSAFGIAIDPANNNNVYIGTNTGLAMSNDAGVTWTFADPTPGDIATDIWDVIVHNGGIIDIVGADGHYRSIDGGTIWTTAGSVFNALPGGISSIAVSPDESYVLFATVGANLWESLDAGNSWTNLGNPRGAGQARIPFVQVNDRTGNNYDIWYGNVDLSLASATTPASPAPGGASRVPAFATWTNGLSTGSGAHNDCGNMIFDPTQTVDACPVLFSNDGGVYYNTRTGANCQTVAWEQPNTTPHGLWPFSMTGLVQPGNPAEDLYLMNQDNGTFATINGAAPSPAWNNVDCCDGFDVRADNNNNVLYTLCCFGGAAPVRNQVRLANNGLALPAQINNYPADGVIRGFRFPDILDQFGPNQFVLLTRNCGPFPNGIDDDMDGFIDEANETGGGCTGVNGGDGGVYITTNINANPINWVELGNATEPNSNFACGVYASVNGAGTPTFYVQVGNCDGSSFDRIWTYTGTAPTNTWQQITPPGGGFFGVFTADPSNPNRLFASQIRLGQPPRMIMSSDGGTTWDLLPALDQLMTGNGTFRFTTARGALNFTGFGPYVQPSLVAFHPNNPNVMVAGGMDSGLFFSNDGGICWTLISDPNTPHISGTPHIPRPKYVHFSDQAPVGGLNVIDLYFGAQGRGVWKAQVSYPNPPTTTLTASIGSPTCPGGCDGNIDLSPAGGTGPYSFLWDNNASTEDISGLCAGNYRVTVSDQNGCITAEFTVPDGVDNTRPAISCDPPMDLSCELPSHPDFIGRPSATDDCGIASLTFVDNITAGTCLNQFTISRDWTVFDVNGNSNGCNQIIEIIDTTAPTLTLPANITVSCDTSSTNTGFAAASDNCTGAISISYSDVVTTGDCNWRCFINRTWTAVDVCGNSSSQIQQIEKNTLPLIEAALMQDLDSDGTADGLRMGIPSSSNLFIPAAQSACILEWLPGTGSTPNSLLRGKQTATTDCQPGTNPVDVDNQLLNPLLAAAIHLQVVLLIHPDYANTPLDSLDCTIAPIVLQTVRRQPTVGELMNVTHKALSNIVLVPHRAELLEALECIIAPINPCEA